MSSKYNAAKLTNFTNLIAVTPCFTSKAQQIKKKGYASSAAKLMKLYIYFEKENF